MAIPSARLEDQPMMEMNTTPLIDVMLVLLIMFIITIPVATHSIDFETPGLGITDGKIDPVVNNVTVTADDKVLWNGAEVTRPALAGLLQQTRRLPVEPELQYQPQPQASYDSAAKVTQIIRASGVTKFGFVGNERFSEFGR